mgnify:FL=1
MEKYIKNQHLRKIDFFKKTGISPSNFKGEGSKSELGGDKIAKILSVYSDINPDWLLTGQGSMLRETHLITPSTNLDRRGAPYYNVDFTGGVDLIFNDQSTLPAFYIDFTPYNKEGVIWCNLTGHSMEPELSNGDIIAMKELTTPVAYLPAGEIYGIVTDEYRTVKRIAKSPKEGYVRLIPTNHAPEYSEQEIPISMIKRIYAVMGSIRKFF